MKHPRTSAPMLALIAGSLAAMPARADLSISISFGWCDPDPCAAWVPIDEPCDSWSSSWYDGSAPRYWRYDPCLGHWRWFSYDPDCWWDGGGWSWAPSTTCVTTYSSWGSTTWCTSWYTPVYASVWRPWSSWSIGWCDSRWSIGSSWGYRDGYHDGYRDGWRDRDRESCDRPVVHHERPAPSVSGLSLSKPAINYPQAFGHAGGGVLPSTMGVAGHAAAEALREPERIAERTKPHRIERPEFKPERFEHPESKPMRVEAQPAPAVAPFKPAPFEGKPIARAPESPIAEPFRQRPYEGKPMTRTPEPKPMQAEPFKPAPFEGKPITRAPESKPASIEPVKPMQGRGRAPRGMYPAKPMPVEVPTYPASNNEQGKQPMPVVKPVAPAAPTAKPQEAPAYKPAPDRKPEYRQPTRKPAEMPSAKPAPASRAESPRARAPEPMTRPAPAAKPVSPATAPAPQGKPTNDERKRGER